jgi:hypothetical protein
VIRATSGSSLVPTGSVTFKDFSTVLGARTLSADGTATFSSAALAGGNHAITASYSGDNHFASSTSPVFGETVQKATSSTALASSVNASSFGQIVTFTATLTDATSATPTGMVTFEDNSVTLATNPLNAAGQALFRTAALGVGTHSVVAIYRGDRNFLTSSSTRVAQVVNRDATITGVKSNLNPSAAGQSVTFTGSVFAKGPGSGTPTGSVTFKDGSIVLGTGTLSSAGQATFSTASLAVGGHAITAVYGGDGNFTASTSQVFGQTAHAAATALAAPFAEPSTTSQPSVANRAGSTDASPSVAVSRGAFARLSPTSLDHFFLSLPSSDLTPRLVATRRRESETTEDWLGRLF